MSPLTQTIEIPREVPVMTLSRTVLFPQAMLPLHIFESRYRKMLSDILASDRIFAVAALNEFEADAEVLETPYSIAGVGVVRACRQNTDGSSDLILQGFARVAFEKIVSETPYRKARIHQLVSEADSPAEAIGTIPQNLIKLIKTQARLGAEIPTEVIQYLSSLKEPESVLDLAIYTLCTSVELKQELLETRGIVPRYQKFRRFLRSEIEHLKLDYQLRNGLSEEQIENN